MAVTQDLEVFRGGVKVFTFTLAPGAPAVDITGWNISMFVRAAQALPVLITKAAVIVGNSPTSTFTVTLVNADTTQASPATPPGKYVYSVHRTDPGSEDVLACGHLVILESYRQ